MLRTAAVTVLCSAVLAACTSSTHPTPGPDSTRTTTRTTTAGHTVAPPADPVASAPTIAAPASACPFVTAAFVRNAIGMRLGRITVLRSGGRTVGCRFYALQGSSLHASEHLPGPHQPAVEIATARYASATAAHNAFVRIADRGSNPQQVDLGGGIVGVCFQTAFDPADHGTDWACATSRNRTSLVVRTVVTSPALDARLVTTQVLHAV